MKKYQTVLVLFLFVFLQGLFSANYANSTVNYISNIELFKYDGAYGVAFTMKMPAKFPNPEFFGSIIYDCETTGLTDREIEKASSEVYDEFNRKVRLWWNESKAKFTKTGFLINDIEVICEKNSVGVKFGSQKRLFTYLNRDRSFSGVIGGFPYQSLLQNGGLKGDNLAVNWLATKVEKNQQLVGVVRENNFDVLSLRYQNKNLPLVFNGKSYSYNIDFKKDFQLYQRTGQTLEWSVATVNLDKGYLKFSTTQNFPK